MIEFDVDMSYLLEAGELDHVVLNDENGEYEPMEFRPSGGECECVWNEQDGTFRCSSCDTLLTNEISIEWPSHKVTPITMPNYCHNCGKAVKR